MNKEFVPYEQALQLKELEELRMKRKGELEPYAEFAPLIDLGTLTEEDYIKVLTGAKLQYEFKQAQEAQRQAEELRLQKIEEVRVMRLKEVVELGLYLLLLMRRK